MVRMQVSISRSRKRLVPRERLLQRLGTGGGRITLVAAPAGWGKTTLLADWVEDRQSCLSTSQATGRIAWLPLDSSDAGARRFLSHLIDALAGAGGIDPGTFPAVVPAAPEGIRAIGARLAGAIAARAVPLTLVLDDYHCVEERLAHDLVQSLIDDLPPNLHLVISSRVGPPLALSCYRSRGLLHELRCNDLRFDVEEARALLNGRLGLSLGEEEVAELVRRTEGGAAGLGWAAMALAEGEGVPERERLAADAVDRQPEDVRRFLAATSILSRLNASLCDAVTGGTDAAEILARLDASDLFVVPLDEARCWYRYHPLFTTLLRQQLAAGEVAELHRRASAWYLAHELPEPALEHALAAEDVEGAVDILRTHALARTVSGEPSAVLRWFDAMPQLRIVRDPELILIRAVAAIADQQFVQAEKMVDMVDKQLTDASPAPLRGALHAVRGSLLHATGDDEGDGRTDLVKARGLIEPDSFWFTMVAFHLGVGAVLRAEPHAMVAELADARARHELPAQRVIATLAQTFTAWGHWWRGEPDVALQLARQMSGWTGGTPHEAFPTSVMAQVYLSWNDLATARACAERAVEQGRRGIPLARFDAARVLAEVAEAQRDWETATRAAAEAARAARDLAGHLPWVCAAEALMQRILFRRGHVDAVERWLVANRIVERLMVWDVRRAGGILCDTALLLAARLRMERGEWQDALSIVDEVLVRADETSRVTSLVEPLILRALIKERRGVPEESAAAMRRAIETAAPARLLRPFVDEGAETLLPLLARVAAGGDFLIRLQAAFAPPLSDRELEILRVISTGASNRTAGEQLHLSQFTVKTHLQNIYAKLHVPGRRAALERARDLNLV